MRFLATAAVAGVLAFGAFNLSTPAGAAPSSAGAAPFARAADPGLIVPVQYGERRVYRTRPPYRADRRYRRIYPPYRPLPRVVCRIRYRTVYSPIYGYVRRPVRVCVRR